MRKSYCHPFTVDLYPLKEILNTLLTIKSTSCILYVDIKMIRLLHIFKRKFSPNGQVGVTLLISPFGHFICEGLT